MFKNKSFVIGLMTSVVLFSCVLPVFAFASSLIFDDRQWKYYRDIDTDQINGFIRITLPATSSKEGNDFADIRIVTKNQEEMTPVPYFITKDSVIKSNEIRGVIIDKTVINGNTIFIVDTGEVGNIHTGLRISSPSPDFRRKLSIFSSNVLLPIDSLAWNIVLDNGYIYHFTDPNSRFYSGKDFVDFSANTSRYLKIFISAGLEGPVNVSDVTVYGTKKIDIPFYTKTVPTIVSNNFQNRTTEIVLDLGESGNITNAVILNIDDRNYIRRVIIESSDQATTSWKYSGQSSISNISTDIFNGSSLRVSYPEQKARYIKISIVNDDNRPLNIGNFANIEGPIFSAVFEAKSNESYRLYYGNVFAQKPVYDISKISAYLEANRLPEGTLGLEIINPLFVPPEPQKIPFTEANETLLNIFLVIIVIIIGGGIGWYLYVYIRKKKVGTGFQR